MKNNIDFILPSLSPEITVLDNDLKVYAFKNSDMDVVRLEFFFSNSGTSNQEKIYSSSVANNQISEGSHKHSSKEIADAIDYYGAFIEKSVDKETASVCFYFLKKYQENLIPWFEEIIKDPAFYQTELDVYIQRLRQQFLVNQQKTDYLARVNFFQSLFGETHPFGVVGKLEDFDMLQRKDLIDFYNSFYCYENCSIIVAGGVNQVLFSLINNSFGKKDWKRKGLLNPKTFLFESAKNIRKTINLDSAVQSSIRIGNATISVKNEDYMGLNVLNCLFGGYFG